MNDEQFDLSGFSTGLFEKITDVRSLYEGWRKVRANRGVGGVDSVSIKDFEKDLSGNLTELSNNLRNNTYKPLPVKFVRVMKANGKIRDLGILTIRDRVAQRTVLDAIEQKIEAEMQDCSFAFRYGRNLEMAIQRILVLRANGFWWTVESDVENFFPSINRETALSAVSQIVSDQDVLRLIELWINSGLFEESWLELGGKKLSAANRLVREAVSESFEELVANRSGEMPDFDEINEFDEESAAGSIFNAEKTEKLNKRNAVKHLLKEGFWLTLSNRALIGKVIGVKALGIGGLALAGAVLAPSVIGAVRKRRDPRMGILQGSPLSPVLANLYLTSFDRTFKDGNDHLVRYCDDFVILCRTENEAKLALQKAANELGKLGLKLHPDKTRILSPTDEFEFLGYRFLSDGTVQPPPSATAEMAAKIRTMSVSAKRKMTTAKFTVQKITVSSWRDYFDIFGPRD